MIYIDNGNTVKEYYTDKKIEKAIMTLLETDDELVWSETHAGYGVTIVDKAEDIYCDRNLCMCYECESCPANKEVEK